MTDQNTFTIAELQQKANDGDAQAQFDLAYCYAKGIGKKGNFLALFDKAYKEIEIERNLEQAFIWLTKSAEQGLVNAQLSLGIHYGYLIFNDEHTKKKISEKIHKGYSGLSEFAPFALVNYFNDYDADDDELAFMWFKTAAEQDCAEAQYYLARCYYDGIGGIEQNDGLAFEWFKKAAEQNVSEAQYSLALCYFEGRGIEQNDVLAFEWFNKAAEQDVAEAQYELAGCYLEGRGVEQSYRYAIEWYEKAAKQGYDEAKQGIVEAQYRLAHCYIEGKGVEKSYELGMKWMISAAAQGHEKANNWLINAYISLAIPSCLLDKQGGEQYYKFAVDWCLKKVDGQNAAEANLLLGVLYSSGKGVEQSDKLALDCFKKADEAIIRVANGDDYQSIQNFIDCYLLCKGEPKYEWLSTSEWLNSSFYNIVGDAFVEGILKVKYRENPNHKVFLTLLRAAIYKEAGKYGLAKDCIKEAFDKDEYMDKNLRDICLANIEHEQKLAENIKHLDKANHRMQRLVEQFTHSLGNVIFPDTIYQVAERLKNNPECRKDVLLLHEAYHSEITIKLQGELLRQRYGNTNPEKFRQFIRSCRRTPNVSENTKSIEDILDYAASRVTARFLNQHYAGLNSIRDKILSKKNVSLNALKQKFEDDILLNKSLRPIAWINLH